MSRTANSIKNSISNIIGQLIIVALGFISRTIFINILGEQYLGINGLFANIISLLSLADLGIGTAIVFNMYKPIAEKDEDTINLLMNFYKKAFRIIGIVVLLVGIALIPFLPELINDPPSFINIYIIFGMYLIQSISSYLFFAYKSSLIQANQKSYIIARVGYIVAIVTTSLQIISLYLFKNYLVYLALMIMSVIIQNFVFAKIADKMYPYANKKTDKKLDKEKKKAIIKNCYAISLYKINNTILAATDNIVLSKFIGLVIVGIYSNYVMLTGYFKKFLSIIFTSTSASIGNLHASGESKRELEVFYEINFVAFVAFGIAAIGIFTVSNPFVKLWLSNDLFVLPELTAMLIAIDLYMYGIQDSVGVFRTSLGLFEQAKYRPLFGAIINVAVSISLVGPLGLNGVIIGTITANALTYTWFDPIIVFKYGFKKSPKKYFLKNLLYLVVIAFSGLIVFALSKLLAYGGLLYLITIACLAVIVPFLIITIVFSRTREYKYLRTLIFSGLKKLIGKLNKESK